MTPFERCEGIHESSSSQFSEYRRVYLILAFFATEPFFLSMVSGATYPKVPQQNLITLIIALVTIHKARSFLIEKLIRINSILSIIISSILIHMKSISIKFLIYNFLTVREKFIFIYLNRTHVRLENLLFNPSYFSIDVNSVITI